MYCLREATREYSSGDIASPRARVCSSLDESAARVEKQPAASRSVESPVSRAAEPVGRIGKDRTISAAASGDPPRQRLMARAEPNGSCMRYRGVLREPFHRRRRREPGRRTTMLPFRRLARGPTRAASSRLSLACARLPSPFPCSCCPFTRVVYSYWQMCCEHCDRGNSVQSLRRPAHLNFQGGAQGASETARPVAVKLLPCRVLLSRHASQSKINTPIDSLLRSL